MNWTCRNGDHSTATSGKIIPTNLLRNYVLEEKSRLTLLKKESFAPMSIGRTTLSFGLKQHKMRTERRWKLNVAVIMMTTVLLSLQPAADAQNVMIGTQNWTQTNLDVAVFRNGDSIQRAQSDVEWVLANMFREPAWCYYKKEAGEVTTYGKLYNWYAVNDPRGLAPLGWHIPTVAECQALNEFLGKKNAGKKMKNATGWDDVQGVNTSGFSGLPGGYRDDVIGFFGMGSFGNWWCSTGASATEGAYFTLIGSLDLLTVQNNNKMMGFSIRCIEGEATIPWAKINPNHVKDSIIGKTTTIGKLEIAEFDLPGSMILAVAKGACIRLGEGWRVPTIEELDIMYGRRVEIGGFTNANYWRVFPYGTGFRYDFLNFKENMRATPTNMNFSNGRVRAVRTIE